MSSALCCCITAGELQMPAPGSSLSWSDVSRKLHLSTRVPTENPSHCQQDEVDTPQWRPRSSMICLRPICHLYSVTLQSHTPRGPLRAPCSSGLRAPPAMLSVISSWGKRLLVFQGLHFRGTCCFPPPETARTPERNLLEARTSVSCLFPSHN